MSSRPCLVPALQGQVLRLGNPGDAFPLFRRCCLCVEGELVSRVHTLVAGVVQVYHRLQVVEEEEKGRKVEQEVERESQSEETARMTMHMEMT